MGDNIAFSSLAAAAAAGGALTGVELASFSLSALNLLEGSGRIVAFMDEAGLAFGAEEVGPPRALEEAVAEAYEPRCRCCLLDGFLSDDDDDDDSLLLLLLLLPRLPPAESSPPLSLLSNEELLPEDDDADDDDRAIMAAEAPLLLRILLMLPVFILLALCYDAYGKPLLGNVFCFCRRAEEIIIPSRQNPHHFIHHLAFLHTFSELATTLRIILKPAGHRSHHCF